MSNRAKMIGLLAILLAAIMSLSLTGCLGKHACDSHGGLSWESHGVFHCNDGHKVGGLSGL